jgi:hypothetical protein
MDHAFTPEEAAIVAAAQAAEATTELLRFVREGPHSDRCAFDVEVVGKLAEALKLAIDIENVPDASGPETFLDDQEIALLTNLKASLTAFLEGWAG